MRFFSLLTSIAAVGFVTQGMAAPSEVPALNVVHKRSLGSSQLLAIVNSLQTRVQTVSTNINQAVAGISPSSPADAKAAAGQQVFQQFSALSDAINESLTEITTQANSPTRAALKRQNGEDTANLINALNALFGLISTTIIQALTALGLVQLVPPAMAILTTLGTYFITIATVVVDFFPFLTPIGNFLAGIGGILSGIGSLIPH